MPKFSKLGELNSNVEKSLINANNLVSASDTVFDNYYSGSKKEKKWNKSKGESGLKPKKGKVRYAYNYSQDLAEAYNHETRAIQTFANQMKTIDDQLKLTSAEQKHLATINEKLNKIENKFNERLATINNKQSQLKTLATKINSADLKNYNQQDFVQLDEDLKKFSALEKELNTMINQSDSEFKAANSELDKNSFLTDFDDRINKLDKEAEKALKTVRQWNPVAWGEVLTRAQHLPNKLIGSATQGKNKEERTANLQKELDGNVALQKNAITVIRQKVNQDAYAEAYQSDKQNLIDSVHKQIKPLGNFPNEFTKQLQDVHKVTTSVNEKIKAIGIHKQEANRAHIAAEAVEKVKQSAYEIAAQPVINEKRQQIKNSFEVITGPLKTYLERNRKELKSTSPHTIKAEKIQLVVNALGKIDEQIEVYMKKYKELQSNRTLDRATKIEGVKNAEIELAKNVQGILKELDGQNNNIIKEAKTFNKLPTSFASIPLLPSFSQLQGTDLKSMIDNSIKRLDNYEAAINRNAAAQNRTDPKVKPLQIDSKRDFESEPIGPKPKFKNRP